MWSVKFGIFTILLLLSETISSKTDCTGKILLDQFQVTEAKLIEISVDTPLVLECRLDERAIQSGCSTSNLAYLIGGDTIAQNGIHYSSNSLHLKVNTSNATELTVTCTYNGFGLNNEVITINVGVKPQPINLNCLNFDLEDLICDFDVPKHPAKNNITIEMHDETSELYEFVQFEYYNESNTFVFIKSAKFNPFGRFMFKISVANAIGPPIQQHLLFETAKIVGLPEQVSIGLKYVTQNKAAVVWKLSEIFNQFEFTHTVNVLGHYLEEVAPGLVKTNNITGYITFELDINLPFANTKYNVIIYTCVKNAVNSTAQRSVGEITFESEKRIPDRLPQIIPGAFAYLDHSDDLIIYWVSTPKNLKNRRHFAVKVHDIRSNGVFNRNINTSLSDKLILVPNINPEHEYKVRLIAETVKANSKKFTSITIPSKNDLLNPPQDLKIFNHGNFYKLSWVTNVLVDNFSIFWCKPLKQQQPSECQEFLDTKSIAGNRTSYIFYSKTPKMFAISSNFKGKSSGIKWFTSL